MNLSSIDLNLLPVFEAVMETRSVSRAADRLAMRQPALSAALARLRVAFGDQLFVRAAGAMQPTPRALGLAPRIAAAMAELRAGVAEMPFAPLEAERTFTVASTDYTTLVLLTPVIEALGREAPGIDLRVVGYEKGDVAEMIDRGEIDLALGHFRPAPERAVRQFLCEERFVGLARVDHPLFRAGAVGLLDFASARHALVSVRRDARGEMDRLLAERGLSRRVAVVLPHMLCLPAILSVTDLVAAVPARVATRVGDATLRTFEIPLEVPPWRIEMLWNPAARTDAAAAWLRSRVAEAAEAA